MFKSSPSQGDHGDQRQHKIFSTLGTQSLKSPGPEGCDNLSGSDCGASGCSVGKARCFWRCDSPGSFWTASPCHSLDLHGLARGAEMMKSQQDIPACAWEEQEVTRRHPATSWGACSLPQAGELADPVTTTFSPLQSPVQRRKGGKGSTGSKISQQSSGLLST